MHLTFKTRENGSVFTDFSSAIVRLLHAKYNSNRTGHNYTIIMQTILQKYKSWDSLAFLDATGRLSHDVGNHSRNNAET